MSLVIFVYQQELKNLIPKSAVGTLSSNSSNVIKLIIDAYNVSLHTEHTHTHTRSLVQLVPGNSSSENPPAQTKVTRPSPSVSSFVQSLSSEVILENGRLPEGVSITYKSVCKNGVEGTGENGRKCSNISIGDEVRD